MSNRRGDQEASFLCRNVADHLTQVANDVKESGLHWEKRMAVAETTLTHAVEAINRVVAVQETVVTQVARLEQQQSNDPTAQDIGKLYGRIISLESQIKTMKWFAGIGFTVAAAVVSGIWVIFT